MSNTNAAPPRMHNNRSRGWLLNLLIILAIFFAVQWFKARPLATGDAPELRALLTTAEPFDLAHWRGEPVLVHFWAAWCPICKLEQDNIDSLSEDYAVITVAMQSGNDTDINAYLREHDLSYPAIADPYGEIATEGGVRGVPASFVIDPDGQIRFAGVGYSTGVGLRGRLWAASRLN
jgi:thiol-disulfide isomerase/thioredoxin